MKEKFFIFFGFPGSPEQMRNVENFAINTNQSLENAWIDFLHSFIIEYKPNDNEETLIQVVFSTIYGISVTPPAFEQNKYPEILGKTTFKLPGMSFNEDFVTCNVTGERLKITDDEINQLCEGLKELIEVTDIVYEWK